MKTKTHPVARYVPFGDNALLVEFGKTIDLETSRMVTALDNALRHAGIVGVEELVPTYRSLLVRYSPSRVNYEQLVFCVKDLEQTLKPGVETEGHRVIVPVVYGAEYGPDLGNVAQRHGLSEEQVVKLHSERKYRVYMIGFVAGFPYLGEVADEIATPRLSTPRLKVPAGSVGIAEKQTGIYPCEAPGGWQIIGRTPLKLFDVHQDPPALLKPGDSVEFRVIAETEFQRLSKERGQG